MDIISIFQITFVTIITTFITNIMRIIVDYMPEIYTKINDLYNSRNYKCYITKTDMFHNSMHGSTFYDEDSIYIMESILYCLTNSDINPRISKVRLESLGQLSLSEQESLNYSRRFIFYPKKEVQITDSISIMYVEDHRGFGPKVNLVEKQEVFILTSTKSLTDIKDFIEKCYNKYSSRIKNISGKGTLTCYKNKTSDNGVILYNTYNISNNQTSFDNIYFPDKDVVLNLINKLENKELTKLGLLLYGEPGTGKTSLCKAIAKHTNRHVIDIKLSLIENDHELEEIFLSETILTLNNNRENGFGKCSYKTNIIPYNKRIYIIEDIDAQSDIVLSRNYQNSDKESFSEKVETVNEMTMLPLNQFFDDYPPNFGNKSSKSIVKSKISLSGLLNVLDGIVELSGSIIIMTTNHVEKLDPALIRHGRVNMKLHMKRMTCEDINKILVSYYNVELPLDIVKTISITPADLHAYCQQHSTIESLLTYLESIVNDNVSYNEETKQELEDYLSNILDN